MEHKKIDDVLVKNFSQMGIQLSDESISKFTLYFNELCRWNAKINLTSLTEESDIIVNLFLDSLSASRAFDLRQNIAIIDIGSGGGFPGIPLKIVFPAIKLTLVEPKIKKTAFLQNIIGMLSLNDVSVQAQTIQEFVRVDPASCSYDIVVSKAIRPEDIFPSALSVLHDESRVCIYRSRSLGESNSYFGMDLEREITYTLPSEYGDRVLSILKPANLN